MNPTNRAYLQMHIAVILFGFTAILGALIELPAVAIVWWRVFLTSISLLFFISFGKALKNIPKKYVIRFALIGIVVGLHWICFYGSIKLANSSLALICMATTALFTSICEPLILKKQFNGLDILIGIVIIPAMVFIVNSTEVEMRWGIAVGLLSAFLASIFSILNKKYIDKADFYSITFIELGAATVFITLFLPFIFHYDGEMTFVPARAMDWFYLIILALACTTLAYVLALKSLLFLSAFNSNLIINLEPVYGIILAIIILKEHKELDPSFYIGCFVIIVAIFMYPFLKRRFN